MKIKVNKKNTIGVEILIRCPFDISPNELEGSIDKVAEYLLDLPDRIKEAYPHNLEIQSAHRFMLRSENEYDYGAIDAHTIFKIDMYRWETEEETMKRLEISKNKSNADRKAAKTRQEAQIKREKTLYENLKKKFENEV